MRLNEINKRRIKAGVFPARISDSSSDIIKFVKKNCSQILSVYNKRPLNLLYSGKTSRIDVLFGKSINGRNPLGTDYIIHKKINSILKQCGFKARRDNSIFCISLDGVASDYGNVYVVFPLNGFDYSWCKQAHDLTVQFKIGTNDFGLSNRFIDDLGLLYPQEFIKKYEFENNVGLEDALWMGNEILIHGSYVAIQQNSELIKVFISSYKTKEEEMDDPDNEPLDYDPWLEDDENLENQVAESASCGGTSSGSIATSLTGSPSNGQFFGGNPNTSVYGPIKKNRKKRKTIISRNISEGRILKKILFHVTETINVSNILKNGLIPQIGPRSEFIGETIPAIYLFKDILDAEDAIMNWLGDLVDEDVSLSILKVLLPKDAHIHSDMGSDMYEVVCRSPIPPENITIEQLDA